MYVFIYIYLLGNNLSFRWSVEKLDSSQFHTLSAYRVGYSSKIWKKIIFRKKVHGDYVKELINSV